MIAPPSLPGAHQVGPPQLAPETNAMQPAKPKARAITSGPTNGLKGTRSTLGVNLGPVLHQGSGQSAQLVEHGLGVLQVGGVEALGEPLVNLGEHRACFIALALLGEQSRETSGGAQLP